MTTLVLNFLSLQFAKPHRYLLLIKTNTISKRTKISDITESPIFDSIAITSDEIEISACVVLDYSQHGLEGKTMILGSTVLTKEQYEKQLNKNGMVQLEKKFIQNKGNKQMTVGIMRIKILSNIPVRQTEDDYFQDIDQFELKEDITNNTVNYSQQGKRINYGVVFGSHFPGNEQFKVEIGYTQGYSSLILKRSSTTKLASKSLHPFWNFSNSFSLENLEGGYLTFLIKNSANTVKDKISFPINKLQHFVQYHFKVVLKQHISGIQPHLYVWFQLQSLPLAFIEQVCQLNITGLSIVPEPKPQRKFLLLFSQHDIQTIEFTQIKLDNNVPVEIAALELFNKQHNIPYFISPIIISPIDDTFSFEYYFLKSNFIRKRLSCYLFEFTKQLTNFKSVARLAKNTSCIQQLKSCFFNQKQQMINLQWKQSGKKSILTAQIIPTKKHLYLDKQKPYQKQKKNQEKFLWKDLSTQLSIKQKLIQQMRLDIDTKIQSIESKGKRIQTLRKIQKDLMNRKKFLTYKQSKQKLIEIPERYPDQKINIQKLKRDLISLCEQTLAVQNVNDEMKLRLDTLDLQEIKQTDIIELQNRAVCNSKLLQQQQQKIKHIQRLDELLKIQSRTLLKLQKQFEKGVIDYEMNELLNKQLKSIEGNNKIFQNSLNMTTDEANLERLLNAMRDNSNQKPKVQGYIGKLKQDIQEAQRQLRKKTQIYVKMSK